MKDQGNKLLLVLGLLGSISSIVALLIHFSGDSLLMFFFYAILIIAGGMLGFIIRGVLFRRNTSTNKVFRTPDNAKYNEQFYEYFNDKIRNAKHDIYITGEGFECKDPKGKEIAREFKSAIETALKNNVKVIRLQTKTYHENDYWNKQLKYLLSEYPDYFELYITNTTFEITGLASVCVIDDCNDKDNTVEFMFTVLRNIGTKNARLAGVGIFIENNKELCIDFKERILADINNEVSTDRITLENFDREMVEKYLYFSYGSNMDLSQMKERCPSAEKISNGYVENYSLVFNRKGDYRDGGVASIEPASNSRVYGVIFEMSKDDFKELDRIENPNSYVRKIMRINSLDHGELECNLYLAIPEGDISPDEEYLEKIISAAHIANLPLDYIQILKDYRHKAQ